MFQIKRKTRRKTGKIRTKETYKMILSCLLGMFFALGFCLFISSVGATAGFNKQINYQGKLTNSSGVAVPDGSYCMRFSIYDDPSAGNLKWQETWNSSSSKISIANGLFSVMLGTHTSFTDFFNTAALYLEIEFDPDTGCTSGSFTEKFSPRKKLGSVPSAMQAAFLEGATWAAPGAIGSTTPAAGTFTTVTGTTLTDGTFSVTGGAITGATGNISMWTNDSGYLTSITTHASSHLVGQTDTIFPADPNADKYLKWDDSESALIWADAGGGGVSFGTTTQVPYMNVAGNDFLYSAKFVFDTTNGLNLSDLGLTTTGTGSVGSLTTTVGGITLLAGQDIRPSADSTTAINIAQADGTDFVTFDTTNKRVGIGTTTPSNILHLKDATANSHPEIYIENDARIYRLGVIGAASDAFRIYDETAGSTRMTITSAGLVGIGTTAPSAPLHIRGATDGLYFGTLTIQDTTAQAAGVGGRIGFGGKYNDAGDYISAWATLAGLKESGTTGNFGGYLEFATRPNGGAMTERMRITSAGNVGIGTTAPVKILNIWGDDFRITNRSRALGNGEGVEFSDKVGACMDNVIAKILPNIESASGSESGGLAFFTKPDTGSYTLVEKLTIKANGNVGIGTTNPTEKLHIAGAVKAQNFKLGDANPTSVTVSGTDSVLPFMLGTYADQFAFKTIYAFEYRQVSDGAWIDATGINTGQRLVDNRPTSITIDGATYDGFRITLNTDYYLAPSVFALNQQWNPGLGAVGLNVTLESGTPVGPSWTSRKTFTTATSASSSVIHYAAVTSHNADHYWRITATKTSPSATNLTFANIKLLAAERMSAGAYAGLPFSWNYDKTVNFQDGMKVNADSKKLLFGAGDDASITFTGTSLDIQSDVITATDELNLRGGTNGINFLIGATEQITLTDGKLAPTTDSDIDLGDSTHAFKNVYGDAYFAGATAGVSDSYNDGVDTTITFTGGIATAISTAFDENLMQDIAYQGQNPETELTPISFKWNELGLKQFKNPEENLNVINGYYKAQDVQKFYPTCAVQVQENLTGTEETYLTYNRNCLTTAMMADIKTQLASDGTTGSGGLSGLTQSSLSQRISEILSSFGIAFKAGIIEIANLVTKTFTTETAKITTARMDKMEMVDSITGDIYCTWISNGEWQKIKGECSSITATTVPVIAPENPQPEQGQEQNQDSSDQEIQDIKQQVQQLQQQNQEQSKDIEQAQNTAQQAKESIEQTQEQVQEQVQEVQQQVEQIPQVPTITAISSISDINVEYNTNINSVNLPTTVQVTLSNSATQDLQITWDNATPEYSKKTPGTYVFTGTLKLPDNVFNLNNLTAVVNVIVGQDPHQEVSEVVQEAVSATAEAVQEAASTTAEVIQEAGASLLNGINKTFKKYSDPERSSRVLDKAGAGLLNTFEAIKRFFQLFVFIK